MTAHPRSSVALESQLTQAMRQARDWGYDLPSAFAKARCIQLFERVTAAGLNAELQVSVTEDGAIAIYASTAMRSVTIEIEPSTGTMGMVVCDETDKKILLSSPESTEADVVRELERAA